MLERVLGLKNSNTLTSINNLAMESQGKDEAAEELRQTRQQLELCKELLGPEHPNTLTSMYNLAIVLESQGKPKAAEELHQQALELREKVLGPERPHTLTSMNCVAMVLQNQGKLEEAKELYRQSLELGQKVLGPEHLHTLATLVTMHNLAVLSQSKGKSKAAEELHQQALELYKKLLGLEHLPKLTSINNLILALQSQGKNKVAEELYQQSRELYKNVVGPEHLDMLTSSMNNLELVLESSLFKYERPLEKNQHEIRLIRLQPWSTQNGSLRCKLEYASLDNKPKYNALSYTWSEDEQAQYPDSELTLYVNDTQLHIEPNLAIALSHLRSEVSDLVIWIDAVCINQKDPEEKSWQVGLMRRVYLQAERVLVWLGPSTDDSNKAIDTLVAQRRYSERTAAYGDSSTLRADMRYVPVSEQHPERDLQDELIQGSFGIMLGYDVQSYMPIEPYPIDAVASLFKRKWWGRIWVLQELALASRVTIFCGSKRIDEPSPDLAFLSFLFSWDKHAEFIGKMPYMLDHRPWAQFMTRAHYLSGEIPLMKRLLKDAAEASLEATNPRDHVYALLGLAADREELGIEIDYRLPYEKVFIDLARAYLKRGELWVLSYCEDDDNVSPRLPSWAPDWTRKVPWRRIAPLDVWPGRQEGHQDSLSNAMHTIPRTTTSIRLPPADSSDAYRFVDIDGITIDEITATFDGPPAISLGSTNVYEKQMVFEWLKRIAQQAEPVVRAKRSIPGSPLDPDKARTDIFLTLLAGEVPSPEEDAGIPVEEREEAILRTIEFIASKGEAIRYSGNAELLAQSDDLIESFAAMMSAVQNRGMVSGRQRYQNVPDTPWRREVDGIYQRILLTTRRRIIFCTAKGYVGLGFFTTRPNDRVIVFSGTTVPFVLRKQNDAYRLIGEAYVDGLKEGKLFATGEYNVENIRLV
jgi:tetratricopeptide (TPR) repeat protein